jgi:hypothetical protein
MTQVAIRPLALLLGALALCSAAGAAPASPAPAPVWLQGCWATVDEERVIEEQWMAPRGRTMFGTSRTLRADKVVGYEYMMIRQDGERLSLEVRPSGKAAVVFVADAVDETSVAFANARHDFPQRIGYRRDGPNAVLAWIEGSKNGQPRRVDFRYRQVACAGH